jgi:hypothetical protein
MRWDPRSRRKYRSRNLWECQSPERSCKSARIINRARSRKASPGAFYVSLFSLT